MTTIFPQYDFARHIAGDCADVAMLLKPGEEVHSYEPTPRDIKMIQNSDLFIYTGGENDVWVESILDSIGDDGPRAVRLLDLVETYEEEMLEGMMPEKGGHEEDPAHENALADADKAAADESDKDKDKDIDIDIHIHIGKKTDNEADKEADKETGKKTDKDADKETDKEADKETDKEADSDPDENMQAEAGTGGREEEGEPDEHVWTSPENCVILVEKLTEEFCAMDPEHEAEYRENGDSYRDQFVQLDEEYREMAAAAARRTILFGDRFPFRYLAEELDLTCYAAFSGCSSESEPSAATIAFLIDKAAEEALPVVFKIEFSNGNIAAAICEAAELRLEKRGAEASGTARIQVLQLHSCHNVTRDEFSAGETCLSLMTKNLEALRTALGQAP